MRYPCHAIRWFRAGCWVLDKGSRFQAKPVVRAICSPTKEMKILNMDETTHSDIWWKNCPNLKPSMSMPSTTLIKSGVDDLSVVSKGYPWTCTVLDAGEQCPASARTPPCRYYPAALPCIALPCLALPWLVLPCVVLLFDFLLRGMACPMAGDVNNT